MKSPKPASRQSVKLELQINSLTIDPQSGKITGGFASIKGSDKPYALIPDTDKNIETKINENSYSQETSFKLKLVQQPESLESQLIFMEGTLLNEPFNTRLTGRIYISDLLGFERRGINFVITRSCQAKIQVQNVEGSTNEFLV